MKCSNMFKMTMALVALLTIANQAQALPISSVNVGDEVKLYNGQYGTTNGGEFKVDIIGEGIVSNDFISFCLEKNELINYNTSYFVQNVSDAAVAGGGGAVNGKDPISDATRWVFWQYMTNGFSNTKSDWLANQVQYAIWYLEEEITWNYYMNNADESFLISRNIVSNTGAFNPFTHDVDYNVKVLNLVDSAGNLKQSQLIGEPVPEPATMLLFGTGLVGLAGAARRKRK